MIKKGDTVSIKPEFQDAGDDQYKIIAVDDEQNGRVTIEFITDMAINPTQIINTNMLVIDCE